MKNIFFILFTLSAITFLSCGNDEVADAEVRLRLRYEGNPLVMFERVNYPDGKDMYFSRVSFFIEDFTLKGEENTVLFERDYFTLTDDHLSAGESENGTLIYSGELVPDDYLASFVIGVNAEMNAKVPADFPSTNVLSRAAEYWPGWESYVFAKVEGFIDIDGDGDTETGFALHMGGDEALRSISTTKLLPLEKNNPHIFIDINMEKLFMNNGVVYDIESNPQIHAPEQNPIVQILVDNLVTCFQ